MILWGGDGGPKPLRRQQQAPQAFQTPLTEEGESGWGLWMMGAVIMDRGEERGGNTIFLAARCVRRNMILISFTPQGKNRAMQEHEQVTPPCDCIARVAAGE